MAIKIITDSACDMLPQDIKKYQIEILPLYVIEGETTYRDGIDIKPEILYSKMRQGVHYKTSQIPYADFYEKFLAIAQNGEEALCLCFSSGLSGTYQAAMLARRDVSEKYPDLAIEVIDTLAVTGGLGLVTQRIAKEREKGLSLLELSAFAKKLVTHICHVFTVTDLEYLYRGGRLNKGTAIVGNMLHIHPLLDVDKNGELRQVDKARGEKKLIKKMVEYIAAHGKDLDKQTIYVTNADNPELTQLFLKIAEKAFKTQNFKVMTMAPVIGTHSGPGTLAVFFFDCEI